MTRLLDAESAIEYALKAIEQNDPKGAEALAEAQTAFANAGGVDAEKRISNVLVGLGFSQAEFTKKASEFSGGWQARDRASLCSLRQS